jgi:hypothetical protein
MAHLWCTPETTACHFLPSKTRDESKVNLPNQISSIGNKLCCKLRAYLQCSEINCLGRTIVNHFLMLGFVLSLVVFNYFSSKVKNNAFELRYLLQRSLFFVSTCGMLEAYANSIDDYDRILA